MKRFTDLVADCLPDIVEEFPWDIDEKLAGDKPPLVLDIREPVEFNAMHIQGSHQQYDNPQCALRCSCR